MEVKSLDFKKVGSAYIASVYLLSPSSYIVKCDKNSSISVTTDYGGKSKVQKNVSGLIMKGAIDSGFPCVATFISTEKPQYGHVNEKETKSDDIITRKELVKTVTEKIAEQVTPVVEEIDHDLEEVIGAMEQLGDVEAESLNVSTPHMVCGFPAILYGAGAPSSSIIPTNWDEETMGVWSGFPDFIGQIYINTSASSGGLYYAVNTGAVTDWKNA